MTINYLQTKSIKTMPSAVLRRLHSFLADGLKWVWGIIVLAWILILLVEITGYGHLLHHDSLFESNSIPLVLKLMVFLVAWQVMVIAMMLPSSLPMLKLFARASGGQPQPGLALLVFICAYATVWTGFAIVVLIGDAGLHGLLHQWYWLRDRPWSVSGFTLVVASGFQFTSLKQQCLKVCRHPLSFLTHHYQRGLPAAWNLGIRHGLYCLGCCWALMLVMFVVGVGHLTWMLALTVVMTMERTQQNIWSIIIVLGITLLALSSLVLLFINMPRRVRLKA